VCSKQGEVMPSRVIRHKIASLTTISGEDWSENHLARDPVAVRKPQLRLHLRTGQVVGEMSRLATLSDDFSDLGMAYKGVM
jgi:hypothetical protein